MVYEPDKAFADVVFVHGFGGHSVASWQHKETQIFLNEKKEPQDFWPLDWLLHDLKDFRILTFGYRSPAVDGPEQISINDFVVHIGGLLLRGYTAKRGAGDEVLNRPIIWVAQSLGQLLVKKAIIEAGKLRKSESSSDQRLAEICNFSRAILYFGNLVCFNSINEPDGDFDKLLEETEETKEAKETRILKLEVYSLLTQQVVESSGNPMAVLDQIRVPSITSTSSEIKDIAKITEEEDVCYQDLLAKLKNYADMFREDYNREEEKKKILSSMESSEPSKGKTHCSRVLWHLAHLRKLCGTYAGLQRSRGDPGLLNPGGPDGLRVCNA